MNKQLVELNKDDSEDNIRIIKNFLTVSINPDIIQIKKSTKDSIYIQRIDIIKLISNTTETVIEKVKNKEKWIRLTESGNFWFRVFFTNKYNREDPPITAIKPIDCEELNNEYIMVKKTKLANGWMPVRSYAYEFTDFETEENQFISYNNDNFKFPSIMNIKNKIYTKKPRENFILAFSKSYEYNPLKSISIFSYSDFQLVSVHNEDPYTNCTYEPAVVDSYPQNTEIDVANFCFPLGISFQKTSDMPQTFRFIMTDQHGKRQYCTCLMFTEEASHSILIKLTPIYLPSKETIYVQKVICVLSDFPYYENYKNFLYELYRMQVSSYCFVELEKHVSYFIESCVLNKKDINESITYEFGTTTLKFFMQPLYLTNSDYLNEFTYLPLAAMLPINTLLTIFNTILLEGKILFYSNSVNLLTNVISNLITLIFPFNYPHILIPILPEKMKQFLDAPVPFIMGVNYQLKMEEIADDCIVVNIDEKSIIKNKTTLPDPPKPLTEKMLKKLKKIYDNKDFIVEFDSVSSQFDYAFTKIDQMIDPDSFNSYEFKDSFFEFFMAMFKNFDKFILKSTNKDKEKGNERSFFASKSKTNFNIEFSNNIACDYIDLYAFLKEYNSTNANSFLFRFVETNIFTMFLENNILKVTDENNINNKLGLDNKPTLTSNISTTDKLNRCSTTLKFIFDKIKYQKGKEKYLLPPHNVSVTKIVQPVEKFLNISSKSVKNKEQLFYYKYFPLFDKTKFIAQGKAFKDKIYYEPKFIFEIDEWYCNLQRLGYKESAKVISICIYEIWIQITLIYLSQNNNAKIVEEIITYIIFILNYIYKVKRLSMSKHTFLKTIKQLGILANKFDLDINNKVHEIIKLINVSTIQNSAFNVFLEGLNTKKENIKVTEESDTNSEEALKEIAKLRPALRRLSDRNMTMLNDKKLNGTIKIRHTQLIKPMNVNASPINSTQNSNNSVANNNTNNNNNNNNNNSNNNNNNINTNAYTNNNGSNNCNLNTTYLNNNNSKEVFFNKLNLNDKLVEKKNSISDDDSLSPKLLYNNFSFLLYDYCKNCLNTYINFINNKPSLSKKLKPLTYEEIICSFVRDSNSNLAVCSSCFSCYHPNLYIVNFFQPSLDYLWKYKLSSPFYLIKEINNLVKEKGEKTFSQTLFKENRETYWNLIFYFQYFELPLYNIDSESYYEIIKKENEDSKNILTEKEKLPNESSFISSSLALVNNKSFLEISEGKSQFNKENSVGKMTIDYLKSINKRKFDDYYTPRNTSNKFFKSSNNLKTRTNLLSSSYVLETDPGIGLHKTLNRLKESDMNIDNSKREMNKVKSNVNLPFTTVKEEDNKIEVLQTESNNPLINGINTWEQILQFKILLDLCNSGIEIEREVIDKDFFKDLMNEFKQNTSSYTGFFYFNNEKNFEKVFSRYAETEELELAYNNMKREYSLVIDETDEF